MAAPWLPVCSWLYVWTGYFMVDGCSGNFIGVGVAKELMGGIGMEPLQSGSAGKGFSYPDTSSVSVCNRKLCSLETISGQYRYFDPGHPPLALLAQGEGMPSLIRVIFGHPGGALGETTAFLVILGGLYLVRKGHISWHIPISIVATVFVIGLVTIPTLGWQGGRYTMS